VPIGYPITKAGLDNLMGGLIVSVRDSLNACVSFKALLDDTSILPDSVLTALTYGGSSSTGEIQQIRNSFTSMSLLNTVSRGGSTVPSLVDFWFDAKHLGGTNFH